MKIYQQTYRFAKILSLTLLATSCYAADLGNIGFDDWIISNSCSKDENKLCNGYYRQPFSVESKTTPEQPITITSDEANFIAKGTSVFNGNVIAIQNEKMIYADKATVQHNEQTGELETITALGRVKISQPGLRIDGTQATTYIKSDRKVIDNAVYRIYDHHARGTAKALVVDGKSKMFLTPGSYTTCAPDSNAWRLQASEIDLNKQNGRGQAWHAKLYLKDVPVFYWPYVNFPIDNRRQTGFLQPEFDTSSLDGKTIIVPFYWNIAPNYDSTIRSKYMSLRGFKFDTEWRYLTTSSNGVIRFDFLPHDRVYQQLRNESYANPAFMQATDQATVLRRNDLKPRDFRYRIGWVNTTALHRNLILNINYNDASDGNYLYNFPNDEWNYTHNLASTVYALQRASLLQNSLFGALRVTMEDYKTFYVVNGPSGVQQLSKLPEVAFSSSVLYLPAGFNALINANFTMFRPKIIPDNNILLNYGRRFQMRPALNYSIIKPGWFIMPRVQVNSVQYTDLHISPTSIAAGVSPNSSNLVIPMYDVKTGLIFDRPTSFNNTDLLQTLEPQVYYLYVPYKDQSQIPNFDTGVIAFDYNQVFRDNRFSGLDRVADANQFGLGLTSKLISADTGEELGMLGVGKILYINENIFYRADPKRVEKHWSPWAVRAKLRLSKEYNLEANWVRNKYETQTASLQLQYYADATHVINFGYEYISGILPSNVKQINISTAWPLSERFRLLGKATYDLEFKRELDILAGFEYHTCCTAFRLVYNKLWLPELSSNRAYDYRVRLQFIFKGLGNGLGNADNAYIAREIPGYRSQ